MPDVTKWTPHHGTTLATFAAGGTYSNAIDLGGCSLVGLYSDDFPVAPGSITFRASFNPSGTGYPVQTSDGTPLKVFAFGSGTYYTMGGWPYETHGIQYLLLQIPAGGTTGAGGGTIVLVGDAMR